MPGSINEVASVISPLFRNARQVVFGFEALFIAQSAARRGEAIVMRWDAELERPGWISPDGKYLCVRTGSCIPLHDALAELLWAMRCWRARSHPNSPWFFPSPVSPSSHVAAGGLSRALYGLSVSDGCPRLSSSGLRRFYVSTRVSQGAPYEAIASELGLNLPRQVLKQMFAPLATSKGLTFRLERPLWSVLFPEKTSSELSAAAIKAFLGHQDGRG